MRITSLLLQISFLSIWQTAVISTAICQNGFNKIESYSGSKSVNFDDVLYINNEINVRGDIYVDSLNTWGLLISRMDTNGLVNWYRVFTNDSNYIITNTPSRFIRTKTKGFAIPNYLWGTGKIIFYLIDSTGRQLTNQILPKFGLAVFPFDIIQVQKNFLIFGQVQKEDFNEDLFVIAVDSVGHEKWIKFYGDSLNDEIFGDVIDQNDGNFTISASIFNAKFFDEPFGQGWVRPWFLTIDTSGNIVKEWKGNKNDSRTFGGGQVYRTKKGDWIIVSTEYKDVLSAGVTDLNDAPTVSRLDSNFNLIWKTYLSDYTGMFDLIADMEYDTSRDEIVVAGQRAVYFNPWSGAYEAWIAKLSADGQILWSVSDTSSEIMWPYADPYIGGLEIAPSGSIYAAGYLDDLHSPRRNYGYLIKVTPDGCMSTLCNTTSINDQIQKKSHKVLVYPNPVIDEIHISVNDLSGPTDFLAYDLYGQIVSKVKLRQGDNTISLDLPSGIYFYSVSKNQEIISSVKFVVR
ncbi:MAG: T9SS type A sorting domain-containing protein [Saprospiraceae bacterium]